MDNATTGIVRVIGWSAEEKPCPTDPRFTSTKPPYGGVAVPKGEPSDDLNECMSQTDRQNMNDRQRQTETDRQRQTDTQRDRQTS